MAFNKIEFQGTTIIDLTQDTVTPETLSEGVTAHAANGEVIVGTGNSYSGPTACHVTNVADLPEEAVDGSMATVTTSTIGWAPNKPDGFWPTYGDNVWSDGTNTYYSSYSDQYVFNGENWEPMSWFGLEDFEGSNIWTFDGDIYLSNWAEAYILIKDEHRWESISWTNRPSDLSAYKIWTDGIKAYYSNRYENHYVLNKEANAWEQISWPGITEGFSAENIWTDGTNTYCTTYDNISGGVTLETAMNRTYVLVDGEWQYKAMYGGKLQSAQNVWTDGTNIYYNCRVNSGSKDVYLSYILKGDTWETKNWVGYTPESGNAIWSHANNIYYDDYSGSHYTFGTVEQVTTYTRVDGEWAEGISVLGGTGDSTNSGVIEVAELPTKGKKTALYLYNGDYYKWNEAETWVFNDELTQIDSMHGSYAMTFTSEYDPHAGYGAFTGIAFGDTYDIIRSLCYTRPGPGATMYDTANTWHHEGYKTIYVTEMSTDENFLAWFKENATQKSPSGWQKYAPVDNGDESVVGTWVFDDVLTSVNTGETFNPFYVEFKVPDMPSFRYCLMVVNDYGDYVDVSYLGNLVSGGIYDDGWGDETFKTITITKAPKDKNFVTWLKVNATKIS